MDPSQSLYYIINHVFLLPKLPEKDDSDVEQESALIEECEAALRKLEKGKGAARATPIHFE
jgi:hypothetical protein